MRTETEVNRPLDDPSKDLRYQRNHQVTTINNTTGGGHPVSTSDRIRALDEQVQRLQEENRRLRAQLEERKKERDNNNVDKEMDKETVIETTRSVEKTEKDEPIQLPQLPPVTQLSADHVERYSRQLLLPDGFGVAGQLKLLSSSVLVVGAGGIGSTCLLYLAAAGIGRLAVVDMDVVEMSNLHRQVLHSVETVGVNKAVSACRALHHRLNPTIECRALPFALTCDNALELVQQYDVIVDASDNPQTRYLINDACVLSGKPLVSASAIGTQGQLTVYNYQQQQGQGGGPCYRCLYPHDSSSTANSGGNSGGGSCSDMGVLGPVPGLVGILQAVEVLKILTNMSGVMHDRLLMYDALQCSFLSVKKPPKRATCAVCGTHPTIRSVQEDSRRNLQNVRGPSGCQAGSNCERPLSLSSSLPNELNVGCSEYSRIRQQGKPHVLLDVRAEQQYEMCSLEGSVNIPLDRLSKSLDQVEELSKGTMPVYCICRRGVFSVQAVDILRQAQPTRPRIPSVIRNIVGGVTAWHEQVDPSFPKY